MRAENNGLDNMWESEIKVLYRENRLTLDDLYIFKVVVTVSTISDITCAPMIISYKNAQDHSKTLT